MLFEDILNQTFPLQNIEVVLMDSNSTDNTRLVMEEFKKNNEILIVQIVTNERKSRLQDLTKGLNMQLGMLF